jgi:hypothetical protein
MAVGLAVGLAEEAIEATVEVERAAGSGAVESAEEMAVVATEKLEKEMGANEEERVAEVREAETAAAVMVGAGQRRRRCGRRLGWREGVGEGWGGAKAKAEGV